MKNKRDDSYTSFDPILSEYRKNEKNQMENNCITGSFPEDQKKSNLSFFRKNRTLYLMTQLMFLLGVILAVIYFFTKG